jgi:hypothetical protein
MIAAEEMGVTSKNVKGMASKENKNKEVNRLLASRNCRAASGWVCPRTGR